MLAVAQVEDGTGAGSARHDHEPVGPDDDVLEAKAVGVAQLPDQAGKVKRRVVAGVIGAQQPQRPVDLVQGMHDVLLEGAHQVGGILPVRFVKLALEGQQVKAGCDPDDGDHGEAEPERPIWRSPPKRAPRC